METCFQKLVSEAHTHKQNGMHRLRTTARCYDTTLHSRTTQLVQLYTSKLRESPPDAYSFTVQASSFIGERSLKNLMDPGEFWFTVLRRFVHVAIF